MELEINNPGTEEPLNALDYIGPFLFGRFQRENIHTFDDLIDRVAGQRRDRNIALFRRVFRNARWQPGHQNVARCVGRANRSRRPPHRYALREYNLFGWNAMVEYLRENMPAEQRYTRRRAGRRFVLADKIPPLQGERDALAAFPNYC